MKNSRATLQSVRTRLLLRSPQQGSTGVQETIDRLLAGDWAPLRDRFSIPSSVAQSLVADPSPEQVLKALDHVLNTLGLNRALLTARAAPRKHRKLRLVRPVHRGVPRRLLHGAASEVSVNSERT